MTSNRIKVLDTRLPKLYGVSGAPYFTSWNSDEDRISEPSFTVAYFDSIAAAPSLKFRNVLDGGGSPTFHSCIWVAKGPSPDPLIDGIHLTDNVADGAGGRSPARIFARNVKNLGLSNPGRGQVFIGIKTGFHSEWVAIRPAVAVKLGSAVNRLLTDDPMGETEVSDGGDPNDLDT